MSSGTLNLAQSINQFLQRLFTLVHVFGDLYIDALFCIEPLLVLYAHFIGLFEHLLQQNGIAYILNVSTSSPKPPFVPDEHFMRIPINDNYSEKLLPYFQKAFQFLG